MAINLMLTGLPLYQCYDPTGKMAAPSWGMANGKFPEISPVIFLANALNGSQSGMVLKDHSWSYGGNKITFQAQSSTNVGGADYTGWQKESSSSPRFYMNPTNGALRIVGNLVGPTDVEQVNKTLTYSCTATVDGATYKLHKSIDVVLQRMGSNGYSGFVSGSSQILTAASPGATLQTSLLCGSTWQTDYVVDWYKDSVAEANLVATNQKNLTVNRDRVNGVALFIAQFKLVANGIPVATAAFRVIDMDDELQIRLYTTGNDMVEDNANVTVKAELVNMRTMDVISSGVTWGLKKVDPASPATTIGTPSNTNTITVTKDDTDKTSGGKVVGYRDIEVWAEASI